ncbi:MAG: M1 family metallopeptidase [Thermomicrobiales bacterium]|nr:M1 family metallopeptidase [Thermomicrobiales bacterium]
MQLIFSLLLTLVMILSGTPQATPELNYDPDSLVSIKPALRQEIAAAMPAGMTAYDIDVTIPPADNNAFAEIAGQQTVAYTNVTGEAISQLPFRLYANSLTASAPPMTITSAQVNDAEVPVALSENNSVATVELGTDLAPGDVIVVDMTFSLEVGIDDPTHYGILNYDSASHTAVLAHWYPVVAGRDPVDGWMLDPVSINGDPIFTDAGLYTVTVTIDAGLELITSGVETDRSENNGQQTVTFAASPSRDFSIVTSETLVPTTSEVSGTTITSWAAPHAVDASTKVAEWTGNTLNIFNPLLGEYPWVQIQTVQAPIYSAAAVELPQMFVLGTAFFNQQLGFASYFEFTVAHEAIHMWFYSLVGNNQYQHAFIDEGITNYLSADIYFRMMYGDDVGDSTRQRFLYTDFQRMIEANADVIVDFPTDSFPTASAYVNAVYTKAPLGFAAIHEAMGSDAFFGGLHQYIADFRFRVATPADMEAALQAQTDINVREMWSHWFERREGGLDIRE